MKRTITVGLLFLVSFAALAAGRKEDGGAVETPKIAMLMRGGHSYEIIVDRLASFQERTGIEVEAVGMGAGPLIERTALELASGSRTFSLIESYNLFWAPFKQHFIDLNPYLEPRGIDPDEFFATEMMYHEGKLVALPSRIFPQMVAYRKDLFDQFGIPSPPQTFQDIHDAARIIHEGTNGRVAGYVQRGTTEITWPALAWFGGWDVSFVDEQTWEPQFLTAQAREGVELMIKTLQLYGPPGVATYGGPETHLAMLQGEAAIIIETNQFEDYVNPDVTPHAGSFGFAAVPAGPYAHKTPLSVYTMSIPQYTPHKDAAVELLLWLVSSEMQKLFVPGGQNPNTPALFEDPDLVRELPFLPDAGWALANTEIYELPVIPETWEIYRGVGEFLNAALVGDMTVEQALRSIQEKTYGILKEGEYID